MQRLRRFMDFPRILRPGLSRGSSCAPPAPDTTLGSRATSPASTPRSHAASGRNVTDLRTFVEEGPVMAMTIRAGTRTLAALGAAIALTIAGAGAATAKP